MADHLLLGRAVAVKFMSPLWAAVPSARARFLREARMTASIGHPHVVEVLDCRSDEADEPYIVLELLKGETLEQRVRHRGPLPLCEMVEMVTQACEAIAATHDASSTPYAVSRAASASSRSLASSRSRSRADAWSSRRANSQFTDAGR